MSDSSGCSAGDILLLHKNKGILAQKCHFVPNFQKIAQVFGSNIRTMYDWRRFVGVYKNIGGTIE